MAQELNLGCLPAEFKPGVCDRIWGTLAKDSSGREVSLVSFWGANVLFLLMHKDAYSLHFS